jgi:hypothetical protein
LASAHSENGSPGTACLIVFLFLNFYFVALTAGSRKAKDIVWKQTSFRDAPVRYRNLINQLSTNMRFVFASCTRVATERYRRFTQKLALSVDITEADELARVLVNILNTVCKLSARSTQPAHLFPVLQLARYRLSSRCWRWSFLL